MFIIYHKQKLHTAPLTSGGTWIFLTGTDQTLEFYEWMGQALLSSSKAPGYETGRLLEEEFWDKWLVGMVEPKHGG